MTYRYEPAGHAGERVPSGGPTAGALAMRDHWARFSGGLGSDGIYNDRNVRIKSLHSVGRAFDARCNGRDRTQRAIGDRWVTWVAARWETLGVQYIIWCGRSWRPDRGWRPYHGTDSHHGHIHAELTRAGAARPSALWNHATPQPHEDDMTPDQARKLDEIHDLLKKGAPAVGVPPLAESITQTAYAVAGIDLPKRPSLVTQLRKLLGR